MTSMDLEIIDLTEFVGDIEIPCDYAGGGLCQDDPARWVMFRKPCCPGGAGVRLACELCKEARLLDQLSLECQFCGFIYEHAPEAYSRIEPLERA